MGVQDFARALNEMQSKLIDRQGWKSITEEVKIRKFFNNIADVIKKSITTPVTDNMTLNEIVTKSEQFIAVIGGVNAENTKLGYLSSVFKYTNATSTSSSYPTQQLKSDKVYTQQNR